MKFCLIIALLGTIGIWPAPQVSKHSEAASTASAYLSCGDTPALNQKIIEFVKTKINKTVGRGECWDLAAQALNTTGADWDKGFGFGKEVRPGKDCIYPGDIIQFENVTMEYTRDNRLYKEKMKQHTAVIYEIKSAGDFVLADQNTTQNGRKVGLSPMSLQNITHGKYTIYQPILKK